MHVGVGAHAAGDVARVFYDGQRHPFSLVEGVARTRWPPDLRTPASCTGRADQTGTPAGATKTWDPAGRSFRRTAEAASAESEVRPGPRPPTLRPHHRKTAQAGPEALSTVSLPNRYSATSGPWCRRARTYHSIWRSLSAGVGRVLAWHRERDLA